MQEWACQAARNIYCTLRTWGRRAAVAASSRSPSRCSTRCAAASSFCSAASSYTATLQARLRSRARYSRSEALPGTIWPPRAPSAAARRPRPRCRPSGGRPVPWSPFFDRGRGLQGREVESSRRTRGDWPIINLIFGLRWLIGNCLGPAGAQLPDTQTPAYVLCRLTVFIYHNYHGSITGAVRMKDSCLEKLNGF